MINDTTVNKSNTASEAGGINSSSIGSSLVGQSVSSWLAASGSLSAESLLSAAPSPRTTDDKFNCSKYLQSIEESSDYVSGDSCELAPQVAGKADSETVAESFFNEEEVLIHY